MVFPLREFLAQLLPGTGMTSGTGRPSSQDVGGLSGDRGQVILHGGRVQDYDIQIDGAGLTYIQGVSQGMAFNPAEGQEYVYEMGGLSAQQMTGGFHANVIPKEGGNRFSAFFLGSYAGGGLQKDNLDATLVSQGLTAVNKLIDIYDYNGAVGGPLKNDKLWFFTSFRRWGQKETVAGAFRPIDPLSWVYNPRLGAAGNADLSRPNEYENWNTGVSPTTSSASTTPGPAQTSTRAPGESVGVSSDAAACALVTTSASVAGTPIRTSFATTSPTG